jgi:hypothetical protein
MHCEIAVGALIQRKWRFFSEEIDGERCEGIGRRDQGNSGIPLDKLDAGASDIIGAACLRSSRTDR